MSRFLLTEFVCLMILLCLLLLVSSVLALYPVSHYFRLHVRGMEERLIWGLFWVGF